MCLGIVWSLGAWDADRAAGVRGSCARLYPFEWSAGYAFFAAGVEAPSVVGIAQRAGLVYIEKRADHQTHSPGAKMLLLVTMDGT